jgi:hypothetical protein
MVRKEMILFENRFASDLFLVDLDTDEITCAIAFLLQTQMAVIHSKQLGETHRRPDAQKGFCFDLPLSLLAHTVHASGVNGDADECGRLCGSTRTVWRSLESTIEA